MANFNKNEEGVSAVIGVILMVAITVILAAVIAAFVFQLGNQMPNSGHTVGTQVSRISSSVVQVKTLSGDVSLLRSADGTTVDSATYTVTLAYNSNAAVVKADGTAWTGTPSALNATTVGSSMYFTVPANSQITVIAHYTDGSTSNAYSGTIA